MGIKGKPLSEEHRAKLSASHTGRQQSPETIAKRAISLRASPAHQKRIGRPLSEEHKRKLSANHADMSGDRNPFFGKRHDPDTLEKIRRATVANWESKMRSQGKEVPLDRAEYYREYKRNWAKSHRRKPASDESKVGAKDRYLKWKAEHPEKHKETQKKYSKTHAEPIKEKRRIYLAANRDKINKQQQEYRTTHPLDSEGRAARVKYQRVFNRNRRARERQCPGKHTAKDVVDLFAKQHGKCATCKATLAKSGKRTFHVDHVVPIKNGGSNWPDNLQLLCASCNVRKGAMDPYEWANKHGMLFC